MYTVWEFNKRARQQHPTIPESESTEKMGGKFSQRYLMLENMQPKLNTNNAWPKPMTNSRQRIFRAGIHFCKPELPGAKALPPPSNRAIKSRACRPGVLLRRVPGILPEYSGRIVFESGQTALLQV